MKSASPLVFIGTGAAIATAALFLMSQAVPPTASAAGSYGPPRKNVVNIYESYPNPVLIQPGQEIVIYTVPQDRWLTVTAAGGSPTSGLQDSFIWGELHAGVFTPKGVRNPGSTSGIPFSPNSEIGWVFRPGSQFVVKNTHPTTSFSYTGHSAIGYLSRE